MLITRYPTTRYQPTSKTAPPACPVCGGLQCLCRPRFFAGQLLSEDDLNRLDRYIRDKHRLHNRHLHGWGVVCGLEVTCHECENLVKVSAGYALSPCGDDIVVCEDDEVDVCALIRKCHQQERTCEPRRRRQPTGCDDEEETWVLAICYDEKPSRGITALRSMGSSCGCSKCSGAVSGCGCGCGSGGDGAGCGCGAHGGNSGHGGNGGNGGYANGHHNGNRTKTATYTAAKTAPAHCEPTVICEGYRYEVYKLPAGSKDEEDSGALIERFRCCAQPYLDFVRDLAQAYQDLAGGQLSGTEQYQLCCSMKRRLREILTSRPGHDCTLLDRLAQVQCTTGSTVTITHQIRDQLGESGAILDSVEGFAAGQSVTIGTGANAETTTIQSVDPSNETVTFTTALQNQHGPGTPVTAVITQGSSEGFQEIVLIWYQGLLACLCSVLLPPCPAPADDNCVPLATVTVRRKDCQILQVCNWTVHRKFATTFPNLQYWLSILPFVRELRELMERVCCTVPDLGIRDSFQPSGDLAGSANTPGVAGFGGAANQPGSAGAEGAANQPGTAGSEAAASQPGAGGFSAAAADPFTAKRSRDFASLIVEAVLGQASTMGPEEVFRGLMGHVDANNRPYLRTRERANLPQFMLLSQLAQPLAAAIIPRDVGSAAGRAMYGTRATAAGSAEVDTLRGEVDELRTALDRQETMINELRERLGGNT